MGTDPAEVEAAVERTRQQIRVDATTQLGDFNQRTLTSFNAALANFETTVRSASDLETKPDLMKAIGLTAVDEAIKAAIKELGEAAPAAAVIYSYAKAIKQELERAAQAATSKQVGDWIKDLRTAINDPFARAGSAAKLLDTANDAYAVLSSEDDRQAFIDDLTAASEAVHMGQWPVPSTEDLERALYEGWINAHFTNIGRVDDDISGFVDVRFEDTDVPVTTAAVIPLGDKIASALNRLANRGSVHNLMELAVHKRVCRMADNPAGGSGWSCGWYDDRNVLINEPNSEVVTDFLKSGAWQSNVTQFT